MTNKRSFAQYIKEAFYDKIYNRVKGYIFANRSHFDLTIPRFIKQFDTDLYDVNIQYVNAEDNDPVGMRIEFYPIVIATVEITGKTKYDVESDTKEIWLRLHCTGDLAKGLRDFRITNIEELTGQRKRTVPVSDGLVPFIKPQDLDKHATTILETFYPEVLKTPQRVDAAVLAKRMGLNIERRSIAEDMSIFGQMYFHQCETELYDRDKHEFYIATIPANTIVIDPDASDLLSPESENVTTAHECVHYALHRKTFEFERLCNDNFSKIQCSITGDVSGIDRESRTSWMEWHASFIAPRIIMPRNPFKLKAEEFIRNRMAETGETELLEVIEYVIDDLASFFGVTRVAAKTRMVDVGYEEAVGTYTYIDGAYVKPHKASRKGILKEKQTYSVSSEDVVYATLSDRGLSAKINSGRYAFVDSHIVLNAPKYVEEDADGNLALTKYARYHMDECCLVFDIEVVKKHNIEQRYYSYCVLNRDVNAPYELQLTFHNGYENSTDEKQIEYLRKVEEDAQAIYASLPRDFKGTVEALKKWRKATNQMLADAIGCDERTVRRIVNGETGTTIQNVVAVCMALKLPPQLTLDVIEKSTEKLQLVNPEHWKLYTLLTTAYGKSMSEVRKIATKLNIEHF